MDGGKGLMKAARDQLDVGSMQADGEGTIATLFLQNVHAQSQRHGRETLCQAHLDRQHSSSGRVNKKINTSLVFYENFVTLATLNKMLLHINNTELKQATIYYELHLAAHL